MNDVIFISEQAMEMEHIRILLASTTTVAAGNICQANKQNQRKTYYEIYNCQSRATRMAHVILFTRINVYCFGENR